MNMFAAPRIDPVEQQHAAEIRALIDCAATVVREGRDGYYSGIYRALNREIHKARQEFAEYFGAKRSWKLSRKPFALAQLSVRQRIGNGDWWNIPGAYHDLLDHPFYFREPASPYRPVGLASHLYDRPIPLAKAVALADFLRIDVVQPTSPSWWNPGACGLLLFHSRPEEYP